MGLVTANQFQLTPDIGGSLSRGFNLGEQFRAQQLQQKQQEFLAGGGLQDPQALQQSAKLGLDFQQQVATGLGLIDQRTGQIDQARLTEAADFAFRIQDLPIDQQNIAINERIEKVEARGGDATQTRELLQVPFKQRGNALRAVQLSALPNEQRIKILIGQETLEQQQQKAQKKLTQSELTTELKQSKTKFDQSSKIRAEVAKASGEFNKIQASFDRVKAADPTAAGDIALIFNFMKMLDPGSVVREGEFATAQNAAGVPDRLRNSLNKLLSGERLNPKQRQDFIKQSSNVFKSSEKRQKTRLEQFVSLGKRFGLAKEDVIVSPLDENQEPSKLQLSALTVEQLRTLTDKELQRLSQVK